MITYLTSDQVPAHLKAGYHGKKFKAEVVTEVTIPLDAGLWFRGSRDIYWVIRLSDGKSTAASNNMSSPWSEERKQQIIAVVPGMAVVRSSMFCGKDMGLTFYVHPDNAAALLPSPVSELSEHEQIVLNATCSFKSSYNGRDRYQMACEHYDRPPLMTRNEWSAAKISLRDKGLLNKAGAITVAGRNARK